MHMYFGMYAIWFGQNMFDIIDARVYKIHSIWLEWNAFIIDDAHENNIWAKWLGKSVIITDFLATACEANRGLCDHFAVIDAKIYIFI